MRIVRYVAPVLLATMSFLSPAHALPLPPGVALIPAPADSDPVGGTVIDSLTAPFTVPGSFSGTLKTEVISGDTTNTLGGLTFTYLLSNDGIAGPNSIGRLSVFSFGSAATDASYQLPPSGIAPASIDRDPFSAVIGFNFVPTPVDPATGFLVPGGSSALLVVQTNASGYVAGSAGVIDGGVALAATYVPVPEPASLLMVVLSAVAMAFGRRRR